MRFVAVKIFGDTVVFGPIHVASAPPLPATPLSADSCPAAATPSLTALPSLTGTTTGFFGIVGLAERESLEEVTERMRTDFVPTLLAESVAWPLVQARPAPPHAPHLRACAPPPRGAVEPPETRPRPASPCLSSLPLYPRRSTSGSRP